MDAPYSNSSPQKPAVPSIDLSLPFEACEEALWEAATGLGFFTVVNHGIPQDVIDNVFACSERYFDQIPLENAAAAPFDFQSICGYDRMRLQERKECFIVRARAGCMDKMWPQTASLKDNIETLLTAGHALARRILNLLELRACSSLKPGTLAASTRLWGEEGFCGIGIIHYPGEEAKATPDPDVWRFHPHTDLGLITLVFQRQGESGLECANLRSDQGGWLKVEPSPGAIVVNIGDMLEHWSDRRLRSNLHRVVAPHSALGQIQPPRYSIALHVAPDRDVVIETEESEPITAANFVKPRLPDRFPGVLLQNEFGAHSKNVADVETESIDRTGIGGA